MAKLLHSRGCPAIEGEGECPSLFELLLGLLEFLLLVCAVTGCATVGDVPEVLFGDDGEGVLHEAGLEPFQEFVLHDVDRMTLAEARGCQCQNIEVDRDFTPVFRHDGGSHAGSHFRKKISDLCTEKSPVDILRFIAQNIDNIFHGWMVGNRGEVNFLQQSIAPFAYILRRQGNRNMP